MKKAIDFLKEGNEGYDFRTIIDNLDEEDVLECMVEFAKMHVIQALKTASEVITDGYDYHKYGDDILTAYSLDVIE